MTSLQNHVVSLPLAKRMAELGFEQKSLFCWLVIEKLNGSSRDEKVYYTEYTNGLCITADSAASKYSAYLASELGEMIPKKFPRADHDTHLQQAWTMKSDHFCNCKDCSLDKTLKSKIELCYYNGGLGFTAVAENECDARASFLIYLKENGLI